MSLRAPPPLERDLEVERSEGTLVVRDGATVVAGAQPGRLDIGDVGGGVAREGVEAAAAGAERWGAKHPFRTCVVCGPDREPGDGFGIFPAPLDGDRFVAGWTPDRSLATADGVVRAGVRLGRARLPDERAAGELGRGAPDRAGAAHGIDRVAGDGRRASRPRLLGARP